jgi:3-isopropylmalate dehydrogenase
MSERIAVLAGDGIGPEIMSPAVRVLKELTDFEFEEYLFGGCSIDRYDCPLTADTLVACQNSGAVLLGAVGGPKWSSEDKSKPTPEQGLLDLRSGMGAFANIRPIKPFLASPSPLKPEVIRGLDITIVRELTGGIYFGEKTERDGVAKDISTYSEPEVERVARIAFEIAKIKVTSVDKANVLATSRLWRRVVTSVAGDYDTELEHLLVDNAAMQLVLKPTNFDVLLTENMFGDILSDLAGALTGSIGLLPSASLGSSNSPGIYEPIHGSAPDIAGKGIANPIGMILSAALMLRHSFNMEEEASAIEESVERALHSGLRTKDLGGRHTTSEAEAAIMKYI